VPLELRDGTEDGIEHTAGSRTGYRYGQSANVAPRRVREDFQRCRADRAASVRGDPSFQTTNVSPERRSLIARSVRSLRASRRTSPPRAAPAFTSSRADATRTAEYHRGDNN